MNEMEELFGEARRAADDLYQLRDTYFPANPAEKISELQRKSDLALSLLDSLPLEQRRLPIQRGTYEFLRGKILDVFPDYRKEAEDHLSKAVKLNPSLADAWLCLGNCIWKKGDLASAKNCFTLALGKGSNKEILCQLSMLERRIAPGSENQAEIVEESIQHAKEAITLDVKDGNSWYNLGNACLTSFFVTGAWDHSKLLQSLKAYQNAEKDERMKSNPDLYFNCATVNKYLENYERALSGFEAAALKDPGLNAVEEVQKIVDLLNKLESLLKGQARAKRHAALASSRAADNLNPSYKRITIDILSEGLNKAVAIVGKVLLFVKHESVAPLYYLVCDSNQICYVLSVYGISNDAIKEGDQLTLLEPYYRHVDFSWKGKSGFGICQVTTISTHCTQSE
ncbi:tetratricopeptide repeat protein 5-like isoform X2 [Vitis riparia]|uniref:tetratricopeptide repeat protein 5-like isoform X2 n=1 Tax=Vitis riparia TaxID=96939 RepID=UPI00155A801A|nr:tetratricopeptide repeat protein 5-like isoform X2 [Vitis riparia]